MIKKIFTKKTENTYIQFFRYFFVGGFAFVVDFSLLYILTDKLKIFYLLSATVSFIIGLIVNFALSKLWIFQKKALVNKYLEFGIFGAVGIVGLGLNNLIMWFLTSKLGLYYLLSKLVATAIVYIWNFGARKYILYK